MPSFINLAAVACAVLAVASPIVALDSRPHSLRTRHNFGVNARSVADDSNSSDLEKRAALRHGPAAKTCLTSDDCAGTYAPLIPFAVDICGPVGLCDYTCDSDYRVDNHGFCVKGRFSCGGVKCPTVVNGFSTCAVEGDVKVCNPGCNYSKGQDLFVRDGEYQCVDIRNDPNNCGAPGHFCPPSYNGVGTAICVQGKCSLDCPEDQHKVFTLRNNHKICVH